MPPNKADDLDDLSESGKKWAMEAVTVGWHLGEKDHWGKWTGWDRSTRVPFNRNRTSGSKSRKTLYRAG